MKGECQAVHITINDRALFEVQRAWEVHAPDVPLHVIASPYRSLIDPMRDYVDGLRERHPDYLITVIVAEGGEQELDPPLPGGERRLPDEGRHGLAPGRRRRQPPLLPPVGGEASGAALNSGRRPQSPLVGSRQSAKKRRDGRLWNDLLRLGGAAPLLLRPSPFVRLPGRDREAHAAWSLFVERGVASV